MKTNADRPAENPSRRSMLVLGGLLAGVGAPAAVAVAVADDEPKKSSEAAEARLKLAKEALEVARTMLSRGRFQPGERDPLSIWSRRRMEARLELSKTKADRVAAAQEYLDEMTRAEGLVKAMHEAAQVDRLSLMDAQYRRLEAQSWLEREKG